MLLLKSPCKIKKLKHRPNTEKYRARNTTRLNWKQNDHEESLAASLEKRLNRISVKVKSSDGGLKNTKIIKG